LRAAAGRRRAHCGTPRAPARSLWIAALATAALSASALLLVGAIAALGGGSLALGGAPGASGVQAPGVSAFARREIPPLYLALYRRAAQRYGLDWAVLAGIGKVECDHGRDPAPACTRQGAVNAAGAGGPMQFLASTWSVYGVAAEGTGAPDRWNPADAIFAAANYLRACGAPADYRKAIYAYNHARWYVTDVLRWAERYGGASVPAGGETLWGEGAEAGEGLGGGAEAGEGLGDGEEGGEAPEGADVELARESPTPVRFLAGERARLAPGDGHVALVPAGVPPAVQAMVVAGNELQDLPYGPGGHPDPLGAREEDCSSTVEYYPDILYGMPAKRKANKRKGFDGYVRVSQVGGREGPSFQSPETQRKQIEGWANLRGVDVTCFEPELDQTGGKLDRPIFNQIIERIKAGESDGIVVAKLDRLSRAGVADALRLCEEIYESGGEVAAVDEGVDPTTPVGEFVRTLLLALARMERRRIKENWEGSRARAVERGAFCGPTPLGYREVAGGGLEPDPVDGPLVKEAFEVSGRDGIVAAKRFFEATWPERTWTRPTIRRFFESRVYLGHIIHGDLRNMDAHEPIVDEFTWELAQHPEKMWTRQPDGTFPLSGIATCAACGGPLRGQTTGRPGKPYRRYHCVSRSCSERPHVAAGPLEDYALARVRKGAKVKPLTGDEIIQHTAAIFRASKALEEWAADTELAEAIGPDAYRAGLDARRQKLDATREAFEQERERRRDLPGFDEPTLEDMQTIFSATVAQLTVRRATKGVPVEDRSTLRLQRHSAK